MHLNSCGYSLLVDYIDILEYVVFVIHFINNFIKYSRLSVLSMKNNSSAILSGTCLQISTAEVTQLSLGVVRHVIITWGVCTDVLTKPLPRCEAQTTHHRDGNFFFLNPVYILLQTGIKVQSLKYYEYRKCSW